MAARGAKVAGHKAHSCCTLYCQAMSTHAEDDMDVHNDDMDASEKPKSSHDDDSGLRHGMRRLSVSPKRHRPDTATESAWRSSTPPPPTVPPIRPRVETPTAATEGGMPRTLSSPSLMDSSPKEPAKKSSPLDSPATFSRKHNELTPITRNTGGGIFVDEGHVVMVSPDDGDQQELHGEHLALQPSGYAEAASGQRRSSAPSLPPLPMSYERAKSMGNIVNNEHDDDDNEILEPVQFPSDRKYCHYSFTSSHQFSSSTTNSRVASATGLIPYQPTREDAPVGTFSGEVLGGIFQHGVPMDERQYSIPSIHLAHALNGSTTSYTDEEDDLLHRDNDEASLSSRGSSLYLPGEELEEGDIGVAKPLRLNVAAAKMAFRQDHVVLEETSASAFAPPPTHDSDNDADYEEDENRANASTTKKRVKKRTKRKERQAIEWLDSVKSTNEDISEAASSKFLTSKTEVPSNRRRSFLRNTSSPLEEQLSGAFPPPSDTFPPPTH